MPISKYINRELQTTSRGPAGGDTLYMPNYAAVKHLMQNDGPTITRSRSGIGDYDQNIFVSEIIDTLQTTNFFGTGLRWQRGAIWAAMWLYELEGYAYEIVNNIADYAIGSERLIDFGSEALNDDFYDWRWNPLNPGDTPIQLQHLLAVWLAMQGDIFLERTNDNDYQDINVWPTDPRFIWSNTAGYLAKESMGIVLNKYYKPDFYRYQPLVVQPFEIQDRTYREIPAQVMIHHFFTEYQGQTRGFPLIRRALPYIAILEDFDRLVFAGIRRQINNPGYWSVPDDKLALTVATGQTPDLDDTTDTANKAQIDNLKQVYEYVLTNTKWEDLEAEHRLPLGIEWHGKQHTGLQDHVLRYGRKFLVERIARSVGPSPLSITADAENQNFLSSRVTAQGDAKFYKRMQGKCRIALQDLADFYVAWKKSQGYGVWNIEYKGKYHINFKPYEYQDPAKEAAAREMDVKNAIKSRHQAIRDQGGDPRVVFKEILEEQEILGMGSGNKIDDKDKTVDALLMADSIIRD